MALKGKVVKKRESSSDATLATPSTNEGGRAVTPGNDSSDAKGKDISDSVQENGGKSSKIEGEAPLSAKIEAASADVNTDPTEAQKEAGNYKKGHVQVGSFDIKVQSGQRTDDNSGSEGGKDSEGEVRTRDEGSDESEAALGSGGSTNQQRIGGVQKETRNDVANEPMSHNEAIAFIAAMENRAEVAPSVDLSIENWDALFGKDGLVNTPIGEVKMGDNQFTKMMRQGRNGKLGMIKPTLETPDLIIEENSETKDGDVAERNSSYIFIKAFIKKDGSRFYYFTSISVSKGGKEVIISSHRVDVGDCSPSTSHCTVRTGLVYGATYI